MRRNIVRAAATAARVAMTVGKITAIASLTVPHAVTVAYAKYDLPPPYVSRALGAVLVPINHASRHRYQIPPKLHGVYVLAVSPHGVAAKQGIRPGDVLATVRSHPILVPADVDRLVWGALAVSVTDFLFGVARGPDVIQVNTNISVTNFNTTININTIDSWTSVENRTDWTQIVNQYNTNISTSITDNSYQSDTVINNSEIPEPGQNFDGTSRDGAAGADVPEPGQNFDGSRMSNDGADNDDSTDDGSSPDDGGDDTDGGDDDPGTDDGGDDTDGGDDGAGTDDGGDDTDGGDDGAGTDDGGDDTDGGDDGAGTDDGGDDTDGGDDGAGTDDGGDGGDDVSE